MEEPAKDYTEDTETVVLTRWDKIKKWIEIVMATRKLAMLIWGLVVTTGGSLVVGQATDTKPIRDAAVAIGLIAPSSPTKPVSNDENEIDLSAYALKDHAHAPHTHVSEAHTHPAAEHTHPVVDVPVVSQAAIRAEIEKILPPNHKSLH